MDDGQYAMSSQFAAATPGMGSQYLGHERSQCQLTIRQQPKIARVALGEEKNRKPIDPPPIVQLTISKEADPEQSYMQSPYFFVSCNLIQPNRGPADQPSGTSLAGTLVSSLHRLKDENNDGAFFIFGDLSSKLEGTFALQFNLYEMRDSQCYHIVSIASDTFPVHGPKQFPGLSESTTLTRSFSDQGVRLRIRKEPRTLLRKRGPASDNYVPRSYNRQRLRQEALEEQNEGDESPVSSRHSQVEQQGSMQSPQHVGSGHDYTQQSYVSYHEEPAIKRSITDSDHGQQQNFGQQSPQHLFAPQSQHMAYDGQQRPIQLVTPLATPDDGPDQNLENRTDSDGKQSPFYPQQSQEQYYAGGFVPSPAATRDDYVHPQRFNPSQGLISPGHQQSTHTFPSQAHAQYQQSYGSQFSPSPTTHSIPNAYPGIGMGDAARHSGFGGPEGAGHGFLRPGYASAITSHDDRRSGYVLPSHGFTNPNQNVSAGMIMGVSRSSGTHPVTTGAGSMHNAY